MFRLHKHKSQKSEDRFDFQFSSLQALQVPKGWDKLFVLIISVETGKTACKSGKATVRNGSCRWTDTLSDSIRLTQHDSSKEIEECLFKFVVAMGSARSGVLGEATVNLMSYKNSETAIPVSLPLKKCNHGTVLLVKVHCVTQRAKLRKEKWEENAGSYVEEDVSVVDYNDLENKSDVSDSSFTRSVGSSSSNHLDGISRDLRAEARMWEQNARNLMTDVGKLQDELSDQSKCQQNLELELSESRRECNSLKQEIEELKFLLEESIVKQASDENMKFQAQEIDIFQKELEDEVMFQKESNASLALQLKENTLCTSDLGPESLQMKSKPAVTDSGEELSDMISEIDKLKSDNLLKEQEVEALKHYQRELENQISEVQNEKRLLEEKMEDMLREGTMTTKCLEDLRNEMMVLSSSMDSQVSANKILVKTLSELGNSKHELEKENVQLSERICGLEAQLRYLTDERCSSRLELQNSESYARNLKEEIRRLEYELEAQKVDMKQKLQDMQNRWLEAQEECEYLQMANPKSQTTAESLIEECSLLQKSQVQLRTQNMELHEHCTVLEAELKESEKMVSNMFKEVEALEGKYNLMLEEIASKEKAFNLEIDSLLTENETYKEKLEVEERLLNQMDLEKTVEVDNLRREVAQLREQVSATYEEKERAASEAVHEVSRLRSDKAMLEAFLQEVQGNLKLSESNLSTLQLELETKVHELMDELAASKQKQEVLMAANEKLLELLEDVKSNEEKHKSSEYERQQSAEEISSLKVQLQKTSLLQNEILALKKSLNELKFENQGLESSYQMLLANYEELKANNIQSVQKISDMQKAVSELEDCKRCKVSLEEKLLRLEGDLNARRPEN